MSNWKLDKKQANLCLSLALASAPLLCAAGVMTFGLTGCATANKANRTMATPQGTISLDLVKVGMPESTFKDAILTFVADPNPSATIGGRTQYLSRTRDTDGGQYVAQCLGGQCNQISVYYNNRPVSKDTAMKTLKTLFPADAPDTPKMDASNLKDAIPVVKVTYGDSYNGQLICADKAGSQVKIVQATVSTKTE